MSFNRLTYDSCAYAKTVQQSTDPLEYNLYKGKFEKCNSCAVGSFTNNLEFGVRADVESDLKGHTRVGTKCPSRKFPANSTSNVQFTPARVCDSIHNITPSNLEKIQTSGLKDLSSYGQNTCSFR